MPASLQLHGSGFEKFLFLADATDYGFSLFRAPGFARFEPYPSSIAECLFLPDREESS